MKTLIRAADRIIPSIMEKSDGKLYYIQIFAVVPTTSKYTCGCVLTGLYLGDKNENWAWCHFWGSKGIVRYVQ